MNTDDINKAFADLLATRGVHHQLGITSSAVRSLRFKLSTGAGVSTDTKIKLLQKSGWRQDQYSYTRKDLVEAVAFALRASAAGKGLGAEYLVEKYLTKPD
jgi:hypothetical protein